MKERRPVGEPVLAAVGPPVILSLGVAGYCSVIRTEGVAMRASLLSFIACLLLSTGCAHRQAVTANAFVPEKVLAHAVSWMVRVAPLAQSYGVSVTADPGLALRALPGAASLSGLRVKTGRLMSPEPRQGAPSEVLITAEPPIVTGQHESRVEATYQVAGGAVVRCTVRVRMEGADWLVTSSSGEDCWRKAQ